MYSFHIVNKRNPPLLVLANAPALHLAPALAPAIALALALVRLAFVIALVLALALPLTYNKNKENALLYIL